MSLRVPDQGFIFWPVGTGDSTTVKVSDTAFLQIDLRHMAKSEDDADTAHPVIDQLIDILPTLSGKPYLSTFALTHPDQDHCQGFADLNKRVIISELWMSPRTFRDFAEKATLCDDAKAFHKEAMRRVKATIATGGDPGRGNRIRIIGYDDWLKETDFVGFPEQYLSIPGHLITVLDGQDHAGTFQAFVHAPFKDDSFGDRNDCSLAFQVTLSNGAAQGRALLMGDLKYPTIRRIFDRSQAETLEWNVLLAPHHCSKSVMYWKEDGEESERLKSDIVRDLASAAQSPGFVVASCEPIPATNGAGDNPPHAKAKTQYEMIVPNDFLCTHEHPDQQNPQPIVFEVSASGFAYMGSVSKSRSMGETLKAAGGGASAPASATGFGSGSN